MKRLAVAALLCIAAASSAALGAGGGLVDQIRAGKLICARPNAAAHHCVALSGYTIRHGDEVGNKAWILLAPSPLLVMYSDTPATIRNGQICGPVRKADIDSATFTQDGAPVEAAMADALRAKLWSVFMPFDGKMYCTAFLPEGDGFHTANTVDGQPDPYGKSSHVILVGPKDGWSVGP